MSRAHPTKYPPSLLRTMPRGLWTVMAICAFQHPLPAAAGEPAAPRPAAGAPVPAAQTPAAAAANTFAILEYRVEGNTLLAAIDIERAVTPFLGDSQGLKDIEASRTALERIYHDRGYKTVLVNIPPQRVGEGI